MRQLVVGTVAVLAVLLSSGCSDDAAPPEPSTETSSTEQLVLPTSSWTPGQFTMQALMQGHLRLDDRDCVFVEVADANSLTPKVYAVWPKGFAASRKPGRPFMLQDADGRTVAVQGDAFHAGGGYADVATADVTSGNECVPGSGRVFRIQSEVHVGAHDSAPDFITD